MIPRFEVNHLTACFSPVHVKSIAVTMKLKSKQAAIVTLIVSLIAMLTALPARLDASNNTHSINTVHFTITFRSGMEDLGEMTAGLSEDAYVRISNFLDHDLTRTIAITVWPARTGPDVTGELRPSRACRHYPVSGHINVSFPGSVQGLRRSLLHTIAHAFIHDMFADERVSIPRVRAMPMPDWFSESLAIYCTGLPCDTDAHTECTVTSESVPGIYSLTGFPAFPENVTGRNMIGFMVFLDEAYGSKSIGEIIRDIRDTGDFDDSLKITTGKRLQELEPDFSEYISRDGRGTAQSDEMKYENGLLPCYNISPAVSPDGSLIAYLSATPSGATLQRASLAGQTGGYASGTVISSARELKITQGSICFVDNRISWIGGGKTIMMSGRINNAEAFVFIDSMTGRIESSEIMPFSAVMFPTLSGNGQYIMFTGTVSSSSDLYMYDRKTASISRITDDPFFERDPVSTPDGTSIIYSTNSNERGDILRGAFDIVRRNIKTGTISVLVKNGYINLQPALSPDMKRMLFISNEGGPFNIYLMDLTTLKTIKVTNSTNGASYPAWLPAGDGMAYVINVLQGSDLRVRVLNTGSSVK
jgi:hypothetical protein